MSEYEKSLEDLKKIIVKIGTRIIINGDGTVNHRRLNAIVNDVSRLRGEGRDIVLVSSGAVGLGMSIMNLKIRPRILADKQACAAAGQVYLMNLYSTKFRKKQCEIAQILLSADDFLEQRRFNNIQRTVQAVLKRGLVPIINENDTISTEELKVGDNDKLSSDAAHFLEADLLIILSDQKGLYSKNPLKFPDAKLQKVVSRVTSQVLKMGSGTVAQTSVGGMRAKLNAIKQATDGGTPVVLTVGGIYSLIHGKITGTFFLPNPKKLKRRQRWLAYVSTASGQVVLDQGGVKAIQSGKSSLLAAGILQVTGNFSAGDLVELCSEAKNVIARGRTSYSSDEINKIKGHKSSEFKSLLGRYGKEEVIHRDNLVIYG